MHTFDPSLGSGAFLGLAITRVVYATDLLSGAKLRYRLRNGAIVA